MKKLFILISSTLALFACTKNDSSRLEDVKLNPNLPQKKTGKPLSAGDGKWDLLGYGYDVTGQFANSESATWPIIDIDSLKKYHPTYVDESGAETGTHFFEVGQNASDLSQKITGKLDITGGDGFLFKGTINANFNQEDKWSSKYVYATYSSIAIKRRVKLMKDYNLLKSYLHQGFLNHVQTLSSQQLVETYGTHVLIDIKLGGKLELIYQAETHSQDRITAAGAGAKTSFLKIFNTEVHGTFDQTASSSNFNEKAFVRTIGGNAGAAIVSTVTFNNSGTPSFTFNPSGWASGVTDQNAEMIDISFDGLIPIYELIADPMKKAALQSYTQQYLNDNKVGIYSEPYPINLFHNASANDYALSSNLTFPRPGFIYQGPLFNAFLYKEVGTVPIYQFRNEVNRDHVYGIHPILNYPDWDLDGVAFYAYNSSKPGTIPVYLFYNANNKCHLLHTNINATGGYPGWVNEGAVFWVLPN